MNDNNDGQQRAFCDAGFSPSCTNITELWNIPAAFYLYPATVPGYSNTEYQHSRKPWTLCVMFDTDPYMEQKEFTEYVISRLITKFPQLESVCSIKQGDIIDINYKSQYGKLS